MEKILIVDDSDDFVEMVEIFLTQHYYEIVTAVNGKEALEKIESEKPDIVLLDIMMPEMDGVTALRQIRSIDEFKKIPILMLTAKGQRDDVKEAILAGATDYMVKPFELNELLGRIKKVLSIGFGHN